MITVEAVKAALDKVAENQAEHVDPRVQRSLEPRYLEHGHPCCLVAAAMVELGISTGLLRQLDREGGRRGGGVVLRDSNNPIRKRFDPIAWKLLCAAQEHQDRGATWQSVVDSLLRPKRPTWSQRPLEPLPWNASADTD